MKESDIPRFTHHYHTVYNNDIDFDVELAVSVLKICANKTYIEHNVNWADPDSWYAGFWGQIWWDGTTFKEAIWEWHSLQNIVEDDKLERLINSTYSGDF